jgi:hypothetical protein
MNESLMQALALMKFKESIDTRTVSPNFFYITSLRICILGLAAHGSHPYLGPESCCLTIESGNRFCLATRAHGLSESSGGRNVFVRGSLPGDLLCLDERGTS